MHSSHANTCSTLILSPIPSLNSEWEGLRMANGVSLFSMHDTPSLIPFNYAGIRFLVSTTSCEVCVWLLVMQEIYNRLLHCRFLAILLCTAIHVCNSKPVESCACLTETRRNWLLLRYWRGLTYLLGIYTITRSQRWTVTRLYTCGSHLEYHTTTILVAQSSLVPHVSICTMLAKGEKPEMKYYHQASYGKLHLLVEEVQWN